MTRRLAAAPEHQARTGLAGRATPVQPGQTRPGGRFALFPRRGEAVTARRVRRLMEAEAV